MNKQENEQLQHKNKEMKYAISKNDLMFENLFNVVSQRVTNLHFTEESIWTAQTAYHTDHIILY